MSTRTPLEIWWATALRDLPELLEHCERQRLAHHDQWWTMGDWSRRRDAVDCAIRVLQQGTPTLDRGRLVCESGPLNWQDIVKTEPPLPDAHLHKFIATERELEELRAELAALKAKSSKLESK